MNTWIFLVILSAPNGNYVDKFKLEVTHEECIRMLKQLPVKTEDYGTFKLNAVCVTKDHATGKKTMKNVPLD
jgi:hypothetical protein